MIQHQLNEIIAALEALSTPEARAAADYFGIKDAKVYGVRAPDVRAIAKPYKKNHELAAALWEHGWLETQSLAALIEDPKAVTPEQLDAWVANLNNWAVCDGLMGNLVVKTPFADEKVFLWAEDEREFVRRAAFSLIAYIAVHQKKRPDADFELFFPLIEAKANDDRNFVKKAVNWALRSIGKRNINLNQRAIEVALKIEAAGSATARWIAKDALRELRQKAAEGKIRK